MSLLTFGSLFSGIGGIDLGLERAGMICKWQIENEKFCVEVLEKHWPDVKRYGDIREVDEKGLEKVDLVCGGWPCKNLSVAGRGAGIEGEKSVLFFDLIRIVRAVRPRYILLENVPNTLSIRKGKDSGIVFGELAQAGYDCEWNCIQAAEVGAPHKRERLFIVAYPKGRRFEAGKDIDREALEGVGGHNAVGCSEALGDRLFGRVERSNAWKGGVVERNRLVKPGVRLVVDRFPGKVARLKAIGNSVIPQVAEYMGKMIVDFDRKCRMGE